MGKHLWRKHTDVGFEENHPGCMWSIFHILNYHHWHIVKKMLPHKWHSGERHGRCHDNLRESLIDCDIDKAQDSIDDEADNFVVKESTAETNQANKRSGRSRIRALISKESSKKEGPRRHFLGFPGRFRLRRTISIHYLEPSDPHLDGGSNAAILPDPSMPKAHEKLAACSEKCDMCGTMNFVDSLGHNQDAKKHGICRKGSDRSRDASVNQNIIDSDLQSKDISGHQLKEYVDIWELFNINKELYVKILQDPDVRIANDFHSLQTSNSKIRLTKSGSFPAANLPRSRNLKPSKLKHKQNEIWSFPMREKLITGTQAPKLVASKSSEDVSVPDDCVGNVLEQETSFSSQRWPHRLNNWEMNQVDVGHLEETKQRTEHANEESTKESKHSFCDALIHRSFSTYENKMTEMKKESTICQDGEDKLGTDISVYEQCKGRVHSRKISFPNDSLDKYAQLFEYGFGREGRWHSSRSLKLSNDNDVLSVGQRRKTVRRNLSLPEYESYYSQLNELSRESHCSGTSNRTSLDSITNITTESHNESKAVGLPSSAGECIVLEAVVDTEKDVVEGSDSCPSLESPAELTVDNHDGLSENELIRGKSYSHQEQENSIPMDAVVAATEPGKKPVIGSESGPSGKCPAGLMAGTHSEGGLSKDLDEPILILAEPILMKDSDCQEQETGLGKKSSSGLAQPSPDSVLDTCFQDVITSPAKFPFSEGSEFKPRRIPFDESDPPMNLKTKSNTAAFSDTCITVDQEKVGNLNECADNLLLDIELVKTDKAEFNYVRDVLELSGFTGKDYLPAWHLLDQPLDPSLFEEMEAEEEVGVSCDHQLLFDLVNQALLEIQGRSVTYCPRPLSYSCHIHPMPTGDHVLEAVWARIRRQMSSGQKQNQTLNDVVAGDLAKDDGWMNLQSETEVVALELEDMIFDELLDEMLCV